MSALVHIRPDIADAIGRGQPVVALESTLFAHGLPKPDNLDVAMRIEEIAAEQGAIAATIAVVDGVPKVGLEKHEMERIADGTDVPKIGVRDLPACMEKRSNGATTVASTSFLAAAAGVEVFATGGLGGVHREARDSWDESADLRVLAATPVMVVCAGVKSILDVAATLQRLESLSVPVVGYRTRMFPGFYLSSSGHELTWSADDPEQVARMFLLQQRIGLGERAMVVASPLSQEEQLDQELHDAVLASGLERAREAGVSGTDVTPFLLDHFHTQTEGRSLAVNIRIIENNTRLAARIAVARSAHG